MEVKMKDNYTYPVIFDYSEPPYTQILFPDFGFRRTEAVDDEDPEEKIPVRRSDCVPSCGVLNYLEDGKEVSLRDLITLSVIVSDNTAANLLIGRYGEERFARWLKEQKDYHGTVFGRKLFDHAKAALGLDNYTTAEDTARLLEKIWRGELASRSASEEMLRILRSQRLNGKIPFYLHSLRPRPEIAHKTGENDGVTHDVAIIEWKEPFLLCFLGSGVDAPAYDHLMASLSLMICRKREAGEL